MKIPSDLAGTPPIGTQVPARLHKTLQELGLESAQLVPAWKNGQGGLTFALASGGSGHPTDFFAKWNPAQSIESLAEETQRLQWLHGKHPVPEVEYYRALHGEEILITRALAGESAVSQRWKNDPTTALTALGKGLRKLHDIDISRCPYDWGVTQRMHSAGINPASLTPPPIDRLVLCQGDPCAPNTLIARDGAFLAHLDMGRLGVADRWADLAVMSMSLAWNYPSYNENIFWQAYGIEPDQTRINFYRQLWETE